MIGKYHGGKRKGKYLYVRVGELWLEINELIRIEREAAYYGPYTI